MTGIDPASGVIGTAMSLLQATDAQAEAMKASADLGKTIVTEASNLGHYIGRILGTAPEDTVGLVLGDPLRFVRTAIASTYDRMLTKLLADRQVTHTQPVSPSVAIPLLRAAYDESRPELQEFWAGLIAAAMDPERAGRVRLSFIETLQRFDPIDALILKELVLGHVKEEAILAVQFAVDEQDTELSMQNLGVLLCVAIGPHGLRSSTWTPTSRGRKLVLACLT